MNSITEPAEPIDYIGEVEVNHVLSSHGSVGRAISLLIDGFTWNEVAKITGLSKGTIYRARERLKWNR